MNKKAIASLELAAIVHELQFLRKGKISQIYHQDKKQLLLQLHAMGKGKQLLKIIPGKYVCLTTEKSVPLRPTGFCMQLRKYIGNASILKIEQHEAQRVLVFTLEKKEKFHLIIELFSRGNIILTDEKLKIIGSLERQIWKDRAVKPGETYIFPKSRVNWKKLTLQEFRKILNTSEKKNVVVTLATEVNMGGVYAENLLVQNGIDKEIVPAEVGEAQVKKLYTAIKQLLARIEDPKGYVYEHDITPFPLTARKPTETTESYSAALDKLNPFQIISPYEQKIRAIERTISSQEEAIGKQEKKIVMNTQKADIIYEKYQPVEKLLRIVKEMRKEHDWSVIEKALKKEKKIRSVDLKSKKIVVDL